jgi:hypothetical protein
MVNSHSSTGRGSPSVATHGHVMLVEAHLRRGLAVA